MIKISPRLEAIATLVPINSNVIDIGCDHGLLDIYLYQKRISPKLIASDINDLALNNAKENIKRNHLEGIIETRLGNGLDSLNQEDNIDTIIISGMGANTIIGIIKNNTKKLSNISTIIIQSNTKNELIRKEIIKIGYQINEEQIVKDNNKIYIIIRFIKAAKKTKYTSKELYFGPILLEKEPLLFKEYQKAELKKLLIIKKMIPKNKILERYKINKIIKLYK